MFFLFIIFHHPSTDIPMFDLANDVRTDDTERALGRNMNACKKHRPEEFIGKQREAEVVRAQGAMTAEAWRRIAISEQTLYRRCREYGSLKTDQARRIRDLEQENARPRRAIPDLTLDKLILPGSRPGATESMWWPSPADSKIDVWGFPVCRFACAHAR